MRGKGHGIVSDGKHGLPLSVSVPSDPFMVIGNWRKRLDIGLILKVAGVGILVSAASQILSKSGRDEQSMLVIVSGIIVVLIMLVGEIEKLFSLVISVFGF